MTGPTIRVMSYNVRAFKQDYAKIVEVVRAQRPDILLLQEVPRIPFSAHRVAKFAQDCELTWGAGRRFRMSTTLMTSLRLDVHDFHHAPMPVAPHQEPRGFAIATVSLPGYRPIRAASVHMSLKGEDRKRAIPVLEEALGDSGQHGVVIGGDLNETPGQPVWQALSRAVGLVSADEFTFPSTGPVKRIDGIFASATLSARPAAVQASSTDLAAATDHLPIVVDLTPVPLQH